MWEQIITIIPPVRSRPTIETFVVPNVPVPGSPLTVRARLESSSQTPIDGVEMRLTGIERRYSHSRSSQNGTSRVYKTHQHIALVAMTPATKLGVGSFEYSARFDLPAALPPSYRDDYTTIEYRLDIHVHIPWWPDRHESYVITVPPPSWSADPKGPVVFATHQDGPQKNQLYIEATVDPQSAYVGGAIRGAASISNVSKKLKQVTIALVAINQATFSSSQQVIPVRRYEGVLFATKPGDGSSSPFSIAVPSDEWPSFDAALFQHRWLLELKGVLSWDDDVLLSIPVVVASRAPAVQAAERLQRLPPVGRERRAKVWAYVAERQQMNNDATSEVMSATLGAVDLRIELEQRAEQGLFSVATLSWPDLGVDLTLSERRWTDRLRSGVHKTQDARFDERFALRAREEHQALAVLSRPTRDLLRAVTEVAVHDDSAIIASPGGGHRLDQLEHFVATARALAASLDEARARLPVPTKVKALEASWSAYARTQGAQLERGSLSIRELKWEGVTLDIVREWDETGGSYTLWIQHAIEESISVEAEAATVTLETARIKDNISFDPERRLRKQVDANTEDPRALEGELTVVAGYARALRPRSAAGPYR